MRTFTNLAWPDDPYRASQQLYRRPSAMLVSFTVLSSSPHRDAAGPTAFALAYLPLHRTRAVSVTEQTVAFGFGTVVAGIGDLVGRADLDLMQARRHAAVLTGHALNADLRTLRSAATGLVTRGLTALESEWTDRGQRRRGAAELVDTSTDLDGSLDIADLCPRFAIEPSPAALTYQAEDSATDDDAELVERLGAAATERALLIALACARGTGRYSWDGVIGTASLLADTTWDMFPQVTWQTTG